MNTRKRRSVEEVEDELERMLRSGNMALTDPEVFRFLYDTFPVTDECW